MSMRKKRDGIILEFANNIMLQAIDWLWRFWIAVGKVHLLVGDPGSGKTTLLAEMLAAFSRGGLLPDGTRAPQTFCIYWSGEDGIEDTVGVRLKAAGADLRNILVLRGVEEHGRKRFFKPSDLPGLVNEIRRLRDEGIGVRVIAIDPLPAGSGNSNSNDDVRRALEPLIVLAEEEGIAIIGVRHLSKASTKRKLAERINGSVAYQAVARIVLFVTKIAGTGTATDNPPRGVLVRAKSNIGPTNGGFAFTVEPCRIEVEGGTADSTVLEWDAQALEGDPESIVRGAEAAAGSTADVELADAMEFLRDLLDRGPVHSAEVLDLGKAQGFSPEKLRQALKALGGTSQKEPGSSNGGWYWQLLDSKSDDRRYVGRRERPYDDHDLGHREDFRREDDRRNIARRVLDAWDYGGRRGHPRNEGRFDDVFGEQAPKDPEVEKNGKVQKSTNTEHGALSRWELQIDQPLNGVDGGSADGTIGV